MYVYIYKYLYDQLNLTTHEGYCLHTSTYMNLTIYEYVYVRLYAYVHLYVYFTHVHLYVYIFYEYRRWGFITAEH
jgi:hypothetical protein